MRLFLVASSQVWVPRALRRGAIREGAGRFLLTLKNVYSGIFAQYANFGWAPSARDPAPAERPVIDRWILSRLATVERAVDDALLERTTRPTAARAIIEFVDDDVANWYVRLSRGRGSTTSTATTTAPRSRRCTRCWWSSCRLLAPFAPFVTDWMHRELTGESVHLAPYVRDGRATVPTRRSSAAMAAIRTLATLGRAAREEAGINVRQPLSRHGVRRAERAATRRCAPLLPLLAAELNVKRDRARDERPTRW